MAELTKTQSVKQGTRNFMHKASDKMKVAGANLSRGDTKVRSGAGRAGDLKGCWEQLAEAGSGSRGEPWAWQEQATLVAGVPAPATGALKPRLVAWALQDLDIAIVKATTCNFHVVPKEKHVRSAWPLVYTIHPLSISVNRPLPGPLCLTVWGRSAKPSAGPSAGSYSQL